MPHVDIDGHHCANLNIVSLYEVSAGFIGYDRPWLAKLLEQSPFTLVRIRLR
jgi:hypothetical protein